MIPNDLQNIGRLEVVTREIGDVEPVEGVDRMPLRLPFLVLELLLGRLPNEPDLTSMLPSMIALDILASPELSLDPLAVTYLPTCSGLRRATDLHAQQPCRFFEERWLIVLQAEDVAEIIVGDEPRGLLTTEPSVKVQDAEHVGATTLFDEMSHHGGTHPHVIRVCRSRQLCHNR